MPYIVRFQTSKFDFAEERRKPAHAAAGEPLLIWLKGQLAPQAVLTDPMPLEDGGWFCNTTWSGNGYQLIASAMGTSEDLTHWHLTICETLSMWQAILRRSNQAGAKAFAEYVREVVARDPGLRVLRLTWEIDLSETVGFGLEIRRGLAI